MVNREDLVYVNYRNKSKTEGKKVLKLISVKRTGPLEIEQKLMMIGY